MLGLKADTVEKRKNNMKIVYMKDILLFNSKDLINLTIKLIRYCINNIINSRMELNNITNKTKHKGI
jgi:hypothetical protein